MTNKNEEEYSACDFCGYETTELEFIEAPFTGNNGHVCKLCFSTFAGNALIYPNQYDNKEVMMQISFVGNTILAEIKKLSEKREIL